MMLSLFLACASTPQLEPTSAVETSPAIPVAGPLPAWSPPAPQVGSLENGATLWVLPDRSLPLVSLRIVFPGGRQPIHKRLRALRTWRGVLWKRGQESATLWK